MKPCISQATTLSTPFEADLSAYARGGWSAVELWLTKLETFLETRPIAEARSLLDAQGLKAVAAATQGGLLFSQGPRRDVHWDHFRRRLAILQELGVPTLIVAADPLTDLAAADYGRAAGALAEAATVARGFGVGIALEFQKSAACASLDTTLALIAQSGAEGVGVCLDVFHYYTGPSKFEDLAYLSVANLAWVQVSDLSGTPRELAGDADRILPGEGDFQIGPILDQSGPDRLRRLRLAGGAQPAALADPRRPRGRHGLSGGLPRAGALERDPGGGRAVSMSVATLVPAAVIYREEQNFDWWVYALLAVLDVLAWLGLVWLLHKAPDRAALPDSWAIEVPVSVSVVGLFLPAILMVGLLRMTTEVTPTHVRVYFGWVPTYRRAVAVAAIQRLEVVTYRPIADYGGWGIRSGRDGERVLNARGDRGVRLDLSDGTRLLIGSQRPEELARVLERAMRPGG